MCTKEEVSPKKVSKRRYSFIDLMDTLTDEEQKEDLSNINDEEIQIVSIYSNSRKPSHSKTPMRRANYQERHRTAAPTKTEPNKRILETPETSTESDHKKKKLVSSENPKI